MNIRQLSKDRYEQLCLVGLNSYEKQALIPCMDNELLEKEINSCLKNVTSIKRTQIGLTSTYEEALINLYIPELLKRLC